MVMLYLLADFDGLNIKNQQHRIIWTFLVYFVVAAGWPCCTVQEGSSRQEVLCKSTLEIVH